MDKKQFIARLRHVYHNTKRQPGDSSLNDLRDAFLQEVIAKSNGGWDDTVALQVMGFVEHLFNVQPEATRTAQRITSDDAEATLERFLLDRDYSYEHIPESKDQSPDGYIEGYGHKYLCELKSPVLMFDHNAAPFGYKFSTTHRKILAAIHQAKSQFDALDSGHSLPRILVYTSAHPQLDYHNFISAVRGYEAAQDGTITTDLRNTNVFKNTQPIVEDIDLYIWLRITSKSALRVSYFCNTASLHKDKTDRLIEQLKSKAVSNMDVHANLQDFMQ